MPAPPCNEKYLSQIPALRQLINLGYEYLPPERAIQERNGKYGKVLLENVLRQQLKKINRINYRGGEYRFSEENVQSAIDKIKNIPYDGLMKTNEEIYDLLTLGTSLKQTIAGDSKSHTVRYIDWKNPGANVLHVTAEFSVERSGSAEIVRPDIVLFVNGIPVVVIECKAPVVGVDQGVSQMIRNQGKDYIPRLFTYVQLVMAMNKNEVKYATAETPKEFWSVWKEWEDSEDETKTIVNQPLSDENRNALFANEFASARAHFDEIESAGGRLVTQQDKAIHSLCRPERLLEIIYGFIIFDNGVKKIARYQQFFLVRSAIKNIKTRDDEGVRKGGIVWHTQGSGKSITMVMLTRALVLDPELKNTRIILVTDRKDLDKQLGNTFAACGLDKKRATSGRDLVKHIKAGTAIITTLINKFETASAAEKYVDDSPDIVALVDESHRTNFGGLSANMRRMLPGACFIGFTGTPLLSRERNSFARFGALIEPSYPVRAAIDDKQVVPLIYEGRQVEIKQDKDAVDKWFARHTEGLADQQKADLKKKYSSAAKLNNADRVIYMRAFDISEHFRANWQGSGFKAQLVAPNKATALKYHEYLQDVGEVSSEIIISPPDTREGHEQVGAGTTNEVNRFWEQKMAHHGSEDNYNKQIIDQFKQADEPEILIVVDKLITGFDAPRNTVLYLCRPLREHTLLQAIARVNRLCEGKDYGYIIDYAQVLEDLDKALTTYEALAGFEESEIADLLISINEEVKKLPKRYSDLWEVFREIKTSRDEEAYERHLADEELRNTFYQRLTAYGKTLAIALSSEKFITETPDTDLKNHKDDFKRFEKLRRAVRLRYAEAVATDKYEPKIQKLLDTHIKADDVTRLNHPVNIFDEQTFSEVKDKLGIYETKTTAATADIIAHETKRRITESLEKDPAFYEKFSKLIQDAIDDFKKERISDLDYLHRVTGIRNEIVNKRREDVPTDMADNDEGSAYFGMIKPLLKDIADENVIDKIAMLIAIAIQEAIAKNWKVDFWNDGDAQKNLKNEIDDFFYDQVKQVHGINLSLEQMDKIFEDTIKVAKFWRWA